MMAIRQFFIFAVLTCAWASAQAPSVDNVRVNDPTNPTSLLRIEVLAEVEGRTTIVLVANSDFQPFGFRHYRISDGAPREVFHLRGIKRNFEEEVVEVGDVNVVRIRMGLHPEHKPPELHVVFDLTDPSVLVDSVDRKGNRLVVRFVMPGVEQTSTPVTTASPTPTPTAALTPTPTPTPTAAPTPTPTVVPTAIPTEIRTPTPTPIPPLSIETPVSPSPEVTPQVTEDQPNEDVLIFSEIQISRWPDGSTLVRISADQDIPPERLSHFRLFGEPPRYVITVSGAKAPELPGVVEFTDPNLRRVRLIRRSADRVGEVQFVLELSANGATIEKVAHQGAHIALRIVPPPG